MTYLLCGKGVNVGLPVTCGRISMIFAERVVVSSVFITIIVRIPVRVDVETVTAACYTKTTHNASDLSVSIICLQTIQRGNIC